MDAGNRIVQKVHFSSDFVVNGAVTLVVVAGNESRIRLVRLLGQMHKLVDHSNRHNSYLAGQSPKSLRSNVTRIICARSQSHRTAMLARNVAAMHTNSLGPPYALIHQCWRESSSRL